MEVIPIFLFIKFVIYILVAVLLKRTYGLKGEDSPHPIGVAMLRVVVGLIAGGIYTFSVTGPLDKLDVAYDGFLFYLGLIVVRLGEWAAVLRVLFFERLSFSRDWKPILFATVVSCLLDIVIIAMVGDRRLVC